MARDDLPRTTPKSVRRRQELLDAAKSTFIELGYFETRATDIAKAAGVSHGTFYTHFDSKDQVLRVLIDRLADDLFAASAEPRERTPIGAIETTIRTFMHAYRDQAPMIRILEQATAWSSEFLEIRLQIRNRFSARLEALLRTHLTGHERNPSRANDHLDPTIAAYALGGMVEDFARGCYILGVIINEELAIGNLALIWARAVGLREAHDGSFHVTARADSPQRSGTRPARAAVTPAK